MSKLKRLTRLTTVAAILAGLGGGVQAAEPIQFDLDGAGPMNPITISMFDWAVNNALAVDGNPGGGLVVGSGVHLLSHARLASFGRPDGSMVFPPAGTEYTFVAGFAETVVLADGTTASFVFDPASTQPNFFEIWVDSPPDNNWLTGTGYNNGKRILYGVVTDSSGGFTIGSAAIEALDQFIANDYPNISTIVGSGSTQLSGVTVYVDPDYFPGFDPSKISDLKIFFNTSTVTPYKQANPSANFVGDYAGAAGNMPPPASVAMNVGPVNGGPHAGDDLNFVLQADANQSFELGEEIPGACRVTYGGNDKNGNISPGSFGQNCAKIKGVESCYTFGGQVGAPTADPAKGGPFGEHTHHQVSGAAGDFVFHAGTRSSLKSTRITATACKDPGAIQPARANASFKQIDFEGTGSFRTLSATAKQYLIANGAPADINTDNASDKIYYFRVDMVDAGEPGNKGKNHEQNACRQFLDADQNNPLATADPLLLDYVSGGGSCADVYQFYVCPSELPCEQNQAMYAVRAFLTGGNIQMHKVIK